MTDRDRHCFGISFFSPLFRGLQVMLSEMRAGVTHYFDSRKNPLCSVDSYLELRHSFFRASK
jgi:hypothetical protein